MLSRQAAVCKLDDDVDMHPALQFAAIVMALRLTVQTRMISIKKKKQKKKKQPHNMYTVYEDSVNPLADSVQCQLQAAAAPSQGTSGVVSPVLSSSDSHCALCAPDRSLRHCPYPSQSICTFADTTGPRDRWGVIDTELPSDTATLSRVSAACIVAIAILMACTRLAPCRVALEGVNIEAGIISGPHTVTPIHVEVCVFLGFPSVSRVGSHTRDVVRPNSVSCVCA